MCFVSSGPHLLFVRPHTFLLFSYFTPKLQLKGLIGLDVLDSTFKNKHFLEGNTVVRNNGEF